MLFLLRICHTEKGFFVLRNNTDGIKKTEKGNSREHPSGNFQKKFRVLFQEFQVR